jgi:hypothetical protein
MRTKSIFCSLLLLAFLAQGHVNAARNMKETKEVFSCERMISPTTVISFNNKTGPLKVETWDKNTVKIDITVNIDGDDDQVKKALDYIKKLNFVAAGDKVVFNTKFWKTISSSSTVNFFKVPVIGGKFKMILDNCEEIHLTRLDLSFVLTMPKANPFMLAQSYENATLPDLDGSVTLDLYESELTAGKLPGCQYVVAKYGKTEIDSVKDVNLKLYENNLIIRHAGDVNLSSKYSETEIASAGALNIDSYEDKINVAKHGDLAIKAKYTTFSLADFNKGTFDLYECKLGAGNGNILAISASYCSLECVSCQAIVFTSSYENKFACNQVGDFKAGSSYSNYKISRLDGSLVFTNSNEDKITLLQVGNRFTGISITSKYTDVELSFESGTVYKLDADLKYTSLDFPKSSFRETRYHKEDDVFQYMGVTQGGDENTVPTVRFQMYEGKIILK